MAGINLYTIVRNGLPGSIDVLGLYTLDLKPDDVSKVRGWPYRYVRIPANAKDFWWGQSPRDEEVNCTCNTNCLTISCVIKVHFATIEINEVLKDGKSRQWTRDDGKGSTHTYFIRKKTTYGHEQKHIEAFITAVKNEDPKDFFDAVRTVEAKTWATQAECERESVFQSQHLRTRLILDVDPGHDESRGGPPRYRGVPPVDGYFPRVPSSK